MIDGIRIYLEGGGEYHKIRHGPRILEMLDYTLVCGKAFHCGRLFDTVNKVLDGELA
ncbi:MAG: hypothetical protein AB2L14_03605 [Candidatus Xenobiia bacterium LiM19]